MSAPTTAEQDQQERWAEISSDPVLCELLYKVETNRRGQLILSPHSASRSDMQGDLIALLHEHADGGRVRPEFPIATSKGTKGADVVWCTSERRDEMEGTGDPPTLAPEVCVEVMSESNDWDEMAEKRPLYRDAGAEEVWVVTEEKGIRFFADEERDRSEVIPTVPDRL
ncbi:Uma2 family endonuclease [Salinibacter altiplanensis]|uniref:Uma2 family endonuclease n=1 Tax=Salinibacter altiplanensis TaxID=1803181 RepID=UPI000C9F367C|nr:Uma2 family endonuclease [Salinibacter altiplanensis]